MVHQWEVHLLAPSGASIVVEKGTFLVTAPPLGKVTRVRNSTRKLLPVEWKLSHFAMVTFPVDFVSWTSLDSGVVLELESRTINRYLHNYLVA
jgi:hypothetical protein